MDESTTGFAVGREFASGGVLQTFDDGLGTRVKTGIMNWAC
jgi:hypothetical protein